MSDPVTNVEIEDVLSSIRRLVSENARTVQGEDKAREPRPTTPDSPAARQTRQESEMLVLTADHMVDSPEADVEPAPVAEETHHWGDDGAETAVEAAAEQAALEAALQDAVHEAVEEALEEALSEAAEAPDAEAEAVETTGLDEMAEDAPLRLEPLRFTHTEPAEHDDMTSLADRIAGLEAAVAKRDDQWEPDGEGDNDNAGGPVEALNWEDEEPEENAPVHAWEADRLTPVDEVELVEDEDTPDSQPGDARPRAADAGPLSEPVSPSEPEFEPEADAEPEPEEADPQLARDLEPELDMFAFDEPDSVIDEEALRELVADIVRRELQGSLGERITRNVRKLVRREIHRALAAREFD